MTKPFEDLYRMLDVAYIKGVGLSSNDVALALQLLSEIETEVITYNEGWEAGYAEGYRDSSLEH